MFKNVIKKTNNYKGFALVVLFVLCTLFLSFNITVFSETPSPDGTAEIPSVTQTGEEASEQPDVQNTPTIIPTIEATAENTPTPEVDETVTPEVTPMPTATPTIIPTLTPTPTSSQVIDYLYDFTIPPLYTEGKAVITPAPNRTATADVGNATIGIVEIDNIEKKREFRWSDLIKYLAYTFFALSCIAIVYGLVSMAVLIFFKKDITIAGLRQNKKKKKQK